MKILLFFLLLIQTSLADPSCGDLFFDDDFPTLSEDESKHVRSVLEVLAESLSDSSSSTFAKRAENKVVVISKVWNHAFGTLEGKLKGMPGVKIRRRDKIVVPQGALGVLTNFIPAHYLFSPTNVTQYLAKYRLNLRDTRSNAERERGVLLRLRKYMTTDRFGRMAPAPINQESWWLEFKYQDPDNEPLVTKVAEKVRLLIPDKFVVHFHKGLRDLNDREFENLIQEVGYENFAFNKSKPKSMGWEQFTREALNLFRYLNRFHPISPIIQVMNFRNALSLDVKGATANDPPIDVQITVDRKIRVKDLSGSPVDVDPYGNHLAVEIKYPDWIKPLIESEWIHRYPALKALFEMVEELKRNVAPGYRPNAGKFYVSTHAIKEARLLENEQEADPNF